MNISSNILFYLTWGGSINLNSKNRIEKKKKLYKRGF